MNKLKSRREFIEWSLKAGVALPVASSALWGCDTRGAKQAQVTAQTADKLSILILGGTSFLGPHQIASALSRGHTVATFTRGRTKPTIHTELFEQVEQLIGDREDNLSALENRQWDVVIDNSGRKVDWTRKSAQLLKANCGLYVYTSSTGVYFPYVQDEFKEEDGVVLSMPTAGVDEYSRLEYEYGIMKANSELAALDAFGLDKTLIIRPTYMVGPADKTNRFIHWPIRLSKGGEILVPGKEGDTVQYIDVRDVADWMIRLAESKASGTFNAVGPKTTQNMYDFVAEASEAFEVDSTFITVDDYDFLRSQGIEYIIPWIMPIGNNQGSAHISNQLAIDNGLQFRSLKETVNDTYDWWNSPMVSQEQREAVEQNPDSVLAREQAIIQAWKDAD